MITSLATRLQRATTVALVASCVAVPAAFAVPDSPQRGSGTPGTQQDLRSPDARDSADGFSGPSQPDGGTASVQQDLRSPDARDSADGVSGSSQPDGGTAFAQQDLRSPDARDYATVVPGSVDAPRPAQDSTPGGGFDWSTAGLTAAAVTGLLVMLVAGAGALRHSRRRVVA